MPTAPISKAEAQCAKTQALRDFAGLPGLMGLGLTHRQGSYALKLNLETPLPMGVLPRQVLGVPLVVEVVGAVRRG